MAEEKPASESTLQSLTKQLQDQNQKLGSLVGQGEAQIKAAEDAAKAQREAAREAARAVGDEDGKEIAIKVETEEAPGLFKKLKLGGLAMSFLGSAMTGLTSAFTWLGNAFGPKLLLKLKAIAPWAMILTGLTMAIEDGITGWMKAESWGTSKVSGFLGGFFGGEADGGIKNAFTKAGHFALIGAGIGSLVVPVVGTLVGGLVGAAIGGILGFIGGKKLAKGFDGIGKWFMEKFNKLILGPIKAVWDFIAPSWAKEVTDKMQWSDLLPPGLTKLFNGEYFTFDMPKFTWTDLFPKFLVDLFTNVTKVAQKETWNWMDLLPPFLTKFFTGEYAPGKQEFKWQDLVPEFIWKVVEVAKTAWADTPFTWRSLVPNFILKIIDATTPIEGSFSWTDLVPKFISDLVAAGTAEATKTGEFNWKALLPDWMIGAWDSTVGLAKASYFNFKNLLPEWMQPYITSAEGAVSSALGEVGSWNWKSLLPSFIVSIIDGTPIADAAKTFSWKSLLPQWMVDILGSETGKKLTETASLAVDWWKSLLPDWIVNIMEGKSPFAERDTGTDEKKIVETKKKLDESVAKLDMPDFSSMFDMSMIFAPIRNKINELAADASFPMSSVYPHLLKLFPEAPIPLEKAEAGGIVGMSPFATGSMGKAIGLESGGLFTLSQGEFVLDNQAAQSFLQAAMILKGQDLSGPNLANLQRDSVERSMQVNQAPIIVTNSPTTQINQSSGVMLPLSPIRPSNTESTLT